MGLDRSADQLRIAAGRDRAVVQADTAALPFAAAVLPTVVSLWAPTNVDDWARVMREAGWHEATPALPRSTGHRDHRCPRPLIETSARRAAGSGVLGPRSRSALADSGE